MEMFCPECMGALVTHDGRTARCTLHGGEYEIKFMRAPLAPQPTAAPASHLAPPPRADHTIVGCPSCGQRLKLPPLAAGKRVRCSKCQAEFAVPAAAPPQASAPASLVSSNPYASPPEAMCASHPQVRASRHCAKCATPMCDTCSFAMPDGRYVCAKCVVQPSQPFPQPRPTWATRSEVAPGTRCAKHPEVAAIHYCKSCRRPVCATCDFALPGNIHVCPDCAAKPQTDLSPKRRTSLIWSFVLAVWSTVVMGVLMSGALAGLMQNEKDAEVVGGVIFMAMFVPAVAGTALGFGTLDRRLANPWTIWVAAIWNSVILAGCLLLIVIGVMMG